MTTDKWKNFFEKWGYDTEEDAEGFTATDGESGFTFHFWALDDWCQTSAMVAGAEELEDYPYIDLLLQWILWVQGRSNGCRFTMEEGGDLYLIVDARTEELDEDKVSRMVNDLYYCSRLYGPFLEEVGGLGLWPTDEEIDRKAKEIEAILSEPPDLH